MTVVPFAGEVDPILASKGAWIINPEIQKENDKKSHSSETRKHTFFIYINI